MDNFCALNNQKTQQIVLMTGKTKEYSNDFRISIINLRKEGFSLGKISEMLKCPKSSVQYIVSKFFRYGVISNITGRGRPRMTTEKEDRIIGRIVKGNRRKSAKEVSTDLKTYNNISISESTIRKQIAFQKECVVVTLQTKLASCAECSFIPFFL